MIPIIEFMPDRNSCNFKNYFSRKMPNVYLCTSCRNKFTCYGAFKSFQQADEYSKYIENGRNIDVSAMYSAPSFLPSFVQRGLVSQKWKAEFKPKFEHPDK